MSQTENVFFRSLKVSDFSYFSLSFYDLNGMLHHSFEPLEGCNLLWYIVAPPLPSQPSFCLSFLLFCTLFSLACLFGWMFNSTRLSGGMAIRPTNKGKLNFRKIRSLPQVKFKIFELSPLSNIKEGVEL